MAKKEINKYTREQRLLRIQNCKICKGAPPTKKCNLQGLVFDKCDNEGCDEIIGDYQKEGAPVKVRVTKIKGREEVRSTQPCNIEPDRVKVAEYIPGQQMDFNNLEFK